MKHKVAAGGTKIQKGYMVFWNMIATIFFVAVFIIFPLYYQEKYLNMSYHKWIFYVTTIILFLFSCLPLMLIRKFLCIERRRYVISDYFVFVYGILAFFTYANCVDQKAAFMGTDGWYMGLVAQLLFVCSYLVFSQWEVSARSAIIINGFGSVFTFVVAICQRYGNDFLHLYWEMPDEIVRDYLSTIGNRTWFSAYVCTVFPIGVYLFWNARKRMQLLVWGAYTVIAFACLVTTNSDSAYAGAFVVLFLLFLISFGNSNKMQRYGLVLCMWFGACVLMALLRIPYKSKVRLLRGLSKVFLDWRIAMPCLLLAILLYFLLKVSGKRIDCLNKEHWRKNILLGILMLFIILIILIVLNTTGILQSIFGITIRNQYLMFDDAWGDFRGSSWKLTVKMFNELPLKQKLFGVGPDCFAYYAYSDAEYSQYLNGFWGEAILANAHNEWLNSFFCMGILGGLVYISIFVCVMIYCLKRTDNKNTNSIVPAIGLCIAGYMAHNFFCYQQVSATGVIFVLMGIAMCQSKELIKSS